MGCTTSTPTHWPKRNLVITPELIQVALKCLKNLELKQLFARGFISFNINFLMVDHHFTFFPCYRRGLVIVPKNYRNGRDLILTHEQIFGVLKELISVPFTWELDFVNSWPPQWGYMMKIQLVAGPPVQLVAEPLAQLVAEPQ